jgi:hypothetical protein
MFLIEILLSVVAVYCGSMWLYLFASYNTNRIASEGEQVAREEARALGVCFILAAGFLGLILSNGG